MSRQILAASVKRQAAREAARSQTTRRATVHSIKPLVVQQYHHSAKLNQSNDFELSQWAKLYDSVVGIAVDDVVLMHQELHDWILFDVVSDGDVVGGFGF